MNASYIQNKYPSPSGFQGKVIDASVQPSFGSILGGFLGGGETGGGETGGGGTGLGSSSGNSIEGAFQGETVDQAGNMLDSLGGLLDKLKCWGSSWNPSKAKSYASAHVQKFDADFQSLINNPTVDNLTNANAMLWAYYIDFHDEDWWVQFGNPGKCSKDSILSMLPTLYTFGDLATEEVIKAYANNGLKLERTSKTHMVNNNHPWEIKQLKYVGTVSTGGGLGSLLGGGSTGSGSSVASKTASFGGWFVGLSLVATAIYKFFNRSKNKNKSKFQKKWNK